MMLRCTHLSNKHLEDYASHSKNNANNAGDKFTTGTKKGLRSQS
jgi:hypothetical protein